MAIFHINHTNGDNENDGSSWALAWKNLRDGATAARIAPGDIIKIAKTPDPTLVGNGTWTNLSRVITLAAAVTENIDLCASAWTPAPNVTCAATTTSKEGSAANQITIGASFTTGKIAYKTISPALDLSGYKQVSFWIRSSVAFSGFQLKLCSDTAGATAVDELTLPGITVVNKWHPITINKGAALGAAIQSVALYALVDPGTPVIIIDNIIAVKDSTAAASLSLKSLISKNSLAQGGTHGWHGIQSINGTTVKLDGDLDNAADTGQGYSGTTETVATYKRETVEIAAQEKLNDTGTEAAPIDYQAGYDTSSGLQDGETFLDGINGTFVGLYATSKNFNKGSHLSCVRFNYGAQISSSYYLNFTFGSLCNCTYGLLLQSCHENRFVIRDVCNNGSYGLNVSGNMNETNVREVSNNEGGGIYTSSALGGRFNITSCKNNAAYGLSLGSSNNVRVVIHTANNVSGGVYTTTGKNYLNKSIIEEATEVAGFTSMGDGSLYSTFHDDAEMYNKVYTYGGIMASQSAVKQTTTGVAWKISPTHTDRNSFYPLILPIARVAVVPGSAVSVFAWFLRDSVDITGKMVCRGGQLAGISSDVEDTITAGVDTWEELSITFTPTEKGVVEIEAQVYGGTTNSVYVDSIRIS